VHILCKSQDTLDNWKRCWTLKNC